MFEYLGGFERVLVTGPQRSGTTICAKMIAHDTGLRFLSEEEFYTDSLNRLWRILDTNSDIVVQCPALCRYVHHLAGESDAVVFMKRRFIDIKASEKRIEWRWEPPELIRYDATDGVAAAAKIDYWWEQQSDQIAHPFEVAYDNLHQHPLWVPSEKRVNFAPRQTA